VNDSIRSPDPVSTRSVLSLVFAILGVTGTCPCVGPVAAILLGMGEPSGVGRAGFFLGWVAVALQLLALFVGILFFGGAVAIEAFN
jgi:hypothetical protein